MEKWILLLTTMTLETPLWKLDAEKFDIVRRRVLKNVNLLWRT